MSQTERTHRQRLARAETEEHPSTGRVEVEDIDAVLADIDEILDQEDDFLTRFRQKGGQ